MELQEPNIHTTTTTTTTNDVLIYRERIPCWQWFFFMFLRKK